MSEFINQMEQPVRDVIQKACLWITHFARSRLDDLDVQGLCLALFGISCALKSSAPGRQPHRAAEVTERLLEKLLELWDSPGDGLRSHFEAGGFLTALMASASLVSESPAANMYRDKCQNLWLAVEKSGALTDQPTLLWTGRHLASVVGADRQFSYDITSSTSQLFSNLTSQYMISTNGIQEIVRDLAALSQFGQVVPPLREAERNYLMDALPFWTFFYVKERDLDMVCPLVRGLNYARLHSVPEYWDGIGFILQQSKDNGRFGMQEMAIHLQSLAGSDPIDAAREIYLPLTVASMWALLECLDPASAPFQLRPEQRPKLGRNHHDK